MDRLEEALGGYDAASAFSGNGGTPRRASVPIVRVDGSHDSTERLAAVRKFKTDPSVRVALLSITAAGASGPVEFCIVHCVHVMQYSTLMMDV